MKVINNVFSPSVFKKIHDSVMSFNFEWHYGRRVDPADGSDENPYLISFAHTVGHITSGKLYPPELYHTIETAFIAAMDNIGEEVEEMVRVRIIMNTKADDNYVTMPHVDFDTPHQTALLYVNDSDGPSIIYDQKFNTLLKCNSTEHYHTIKDKMTVMEAVDPVANRMVLFNGLHYHSGTTPKDSARRVVININYKKK
jgi:hypothetical protein